MKFDEKKLKERLLIAGEYADTALFLWLMAAAVGCLFTHEYITACALIVTAAYWQSTERQDGIGD